MRNFLLGGAMLLMVGFTSLSAYADDLVVGPGKKVSVDYTLTVDNKQLETSVGKVPLSYVVGGHNIIPGLENQLNGMRVNEEKVVTVAPKDAYGEIDPKAFREFPKTALPPSTDLKVGAHLLATGADGSRIPVEITKIDGDKVTINFNHPMAGKTMVFKVKILKIENAPVSADASAIMTK